MEASAEWWHVVMVEWSGICDVILVGDCGFLHSVCIANVFWDGNEIKDVN